MSNPKNDISFLRAKIKRLESLLNKKDTPTEQTLNDVSGTLKNLKDLIDPLDLQKKISDYDIDLSDLKGFRTGIDNGTNIPTGLSGKFADKNLFDGVKDDFTKIKTGDLSIATGLKGILDEKTPLTDFNKIKSGDLTDATGLKGLLDSKTAITDFNKLKDGDLEALGANGLKGILDGKASNAAVNSKANTTDVYTKTQVDTSLGLKANASNVYTITETDTALGLKANSANVYTKTETDGFVSSKANTADVYTRTDANNTFRTSAQVNSAIGAFDFSSNANPTVTPILKFNDLSSSHITYTGSFNTLSASHINFTGSLTRLSQSHTTYTGSLNTLSASHALFTGSFTTLSSSHVSRLGILDNHTSSINSFSSSHGFKLSSIAFSLTEEGSFKYASLATSLKNSYFAAASDPTTGYDKGKWYFTNTFPSGNSDYKLSSYSYQGYGTVGITTKDWYDREDFITYRKRLYTLGAGGTYSSVIAQDSELLLQAGKTTIRSGTPNNTSPSLKIIGESNTNNGIGEDQGQLILQDEDNTVGGLMLGYKYVSSANEYARIQAKSSLGAATDLYINAAGGSVRIAKLNNHAIDDSAIELNNYGSGDRNSYIDFHSYGNQDYDSRIIRWSGQAGIFELTNTYSRIRNSVSFIDGTIFDWIHSGNTKMYLESNGNLTLAGYLSDERIKTDIATSSLGLEFINNLNPVQFKFIVADEIIDITKEKLENNKIINDGTRKSGVRNHYGFIAQEVKKAAGNKDFAGVVYEPEKDLYKLNHQEFISPMVKAIQELSQKNDYLQKELEEKDKLLQDILLRLTSLENK